MYRWLRDDGLLEGIKIYRLSCNDAKGTGERHTLAPQGSQSNRRMVNAEE
jgi:hypothetical protein